MNKHLYLCCTLILISTAFLYHQWLYSQQHRWTHITSQHTLLQQKHAITTQQTQACTDLTKKMQAQALSYPNIALLRNPPYTNKIIDLMTKLATQHYLHITRITPPNDLRSSSHTAYILIAQGSYIDILDFTHALTQSLPWLAHTAYNLKQSHPSDPLTFTLTLKDTND